MRYQGTQHQRGQGISGGRERERAIEDQKEGKAQIPALKAMECSVITNRERIVERCAELYQNLHEDNIYKIIARTGKKCLTVIRSEVEKTFPHIKDGKAPGEDGIER